MTDKPQLFGIPDVVLVPETDEQAAAAEHLLPKQRRRARRVATYKRIDVRACLTHRPSDEEQAVLCDISVVGAGLITKRPMKPGEQFLIRLESCNTDLLYRVIRCQSSFDDCYAIGAEYLCVADMTESECKPGEIERIQRFILA